MCSEAQARYREFMSWGTENTRNSVVIGLIQRLELWTQPRIVALTEKNDIDFDKLKDELFTFYLAVPADKPELKPCAAIILAYITNWALAKRGLKHRISLYLDEFTNFGDSRRVFQTSCRLFGTDIYLRCLDCKITCSGLRSSG